MSETLALYAGAIMASRIVGDGSGSSTAQYIQAYYCADTNEDDAKRQLIKKCFEHYPPDDGFFNHDAVVMAIDHRAIAEVYEVK